MKTLKFKLLSAVIACTLLFSACSKDSSSSSTPTGTTPSPYYVKCKINNVAYTFENAVALRTTVGSNEVLTIRATKSTSDTSDLVILQAIQPAGSWSSPLTYFVSNDGKEGTFSYRSKAGVQYSSANLPDMESFNAVFTFISYKKDEVVSGGFGGKVYSSSSSAAEFTEATFNVKIAN